MYETIANPNHEELLKKQPNIIYKYLDWNNIYYQKVLTENELFFSSPKNFNDPFDCKIEKRYDLMSNDEVDIYLEKLLRFKSKIENLNWSDHKMKSELLKLKNNTDFKDLEKMKSDNEYQFSQINNFYSVFCTSKKWNSIAMWGYYALNHTGICLGFNLKKIFFSGKIGTGALVTYDEYPILKPNQSFAEKAHKQAYYKSKDWCHEEEYRLMTYNLPKNINGLVLDEEKNLKGIKITSNDDWYDELYLGLNFPENMIIDILSKCKAKILKGMRVYRVKKVHFQFALTREEIDYSKYKI
ncbi:hypothetical protein Q763_10090 [Flavobacterium beibuense F44-8]|uniref:DUF2971 domain-containing protein n=1 Tax=Flavobacterium beibuense F44-8 TaxID=1406840 RepID=A0A0A2LLR8_9FLAO|nr:DUF2971 domain-containing protein [Flavobacterium beibuense]KGO80869.1 hypothetical protein Q763_10090 [Flavobacterium beibuense F44-8]